MTSKVRIGVLGLTHDHVWEHLAQARANPDTRLVAAADPHEALIGRAEAEFHCRPYRNAQTLLDSEELDAVYIFSDNAAHVELTEMAAARRLHVLVEKPMAADLAGADRMLAAARQSNTLLMVNWPFAWWPSLQHALRLAASGELGSLWQVRYRAAHEGPRELGCSEFFCDWLYDPKRNGPGGAFMDYCCYGAVLARVLLGMPADTHAVIKRLVKRNIEVPDNGLLVMTYPQAVALAEGSWTQVGKMSSYLTMLYGTQATALVEPGVAGRLLLATAEQPEGQAIDVPPPPAELRDATSHLVHCIRTGQPPMAMCEATVCRDAQAILEAGLQSAKG